MRLIMQLDKLHQSDTIGIISPCCSFEESKYQETVISLEKLGFKVKKANNLLKKTYGYSASEQERADDFNNFVADNEVKMILFSGGNVSNEILPLIDFENIKRNPKYIVSYSDGTTILDAVYANTGLITYYGQKPSTFFQLSPYNQRQFNLHFLEETPSEFEKNSEWRTICSGCGEGTLVGGYIENFALLMGGKYFPYHKEQKYLLFLEDHERFNEPVAVSMFLSHIEQSDFMKNVTGLLFGHYSEKEYPELVDRLARFGNKNKIPVVGCDDFGHGANNAILPIGCYAKMNADSKTLCISAQK